MNMISFRIYLQKSYFKSIRYFFTNLAQYLVYFCTYYKSTVLRYTYKVIHLYRYVMAFTNKLSHRLIPTTTTSTPQAAGY